MQPGEYHKMAAVEDAMWYYRALHRNVARALERGLGPETAVLDAGCGTGGLLKKLATAHPGWRLTGLDLSPVACALARTRAAARIVEGPATALPFPPDEFDAVVSCDVVCQVAEPAAALREFFRVLRPGGTIVLTMPAYQWLYSYHDEQVGNRRRYSRRETLALLDAAGFAGSTGTYWNTLPFPLTVLLRKFLPPRRPASDVRLYPAPLEAIFNTMMAIEHAWLGRGGRLPFGSSVLVVGCKPDRSP
jgi:SAM-dependent methyltransferase